MSMQILKEQKMEYEIERNKEQGTFTIVIGSDYTAVLDECHAITAARAFLKGKMVQWTDMKGVRTTFAQGFKNVDEENEEDPASVRVLRRGSPRFNISEREFIVMMQDLVMQLDLGGRDELSRQSSPETLDPSGDDVEDDLSLASNEPTV